MAETHPVARAEPVSLILVAGPDAGFAVEQVVVVNATRGAGPGAEGLPAGN